MRKWTPLVGLALACVLAWGGWTWIHPTVLKDTSALGNFDFAPAPVGTTYFMGVAGAKAEPREVVTLRSATPHFTTNTAHAKASFFICRTSGMSGLGTSTSLASLNDVCLSLRPLGNGDRLSLFGGGGRDEVIMKLSTTQPGETRVDQVSFTYTRGRSHLWQRGTDISEQDWRITAR